MDLANGEHIRKLNDQIQTEKDPAKMLALVRELTRLFDEQQLPEAAKGTSTGNRLSTSQSSSD